VLPLELKIPSLCITIQEGSTKDENNKLHLTVLDTLDEKDLRCKI